MDEVVATRGRSLRAATWIAAAVAGAAVVAVVVLAIVWATSGVPLSGPFAVLERALTVIVLAGWAAAVAGVALGIAASVRSAAPARRMLVTAIVLAPVALLGCAAVTLFGVLWLTVAHPFAHNPAADSGSRVSAALRAHGGPEVCTQADPGLGPDNVQPWYTAWLEVPDSSAGPDGVRSALEQAGFSAATWSYPTTTAVSGNRTATVSVLGAQDVGIDCAIGLGQWGDTHDAAKGDQFVEVQVQLPMPK
ncbi:hypothetical protein [Amnibacterium sp.]|uniref:hypothetical protein n=1 Tax=Amnibacterium sp. TaxID=1872496 RepID=UPI0026051EED|nr:hypothetical protein [Amnibacterium sp.]MCU1474047.1 hypothetical protein [Amnibacterium sp.]